MYPHFRIYDALQNKARIAKHLTATVFAGTAKARTATGIPIRIEFTNTSVYPSSS